MSFDPHHVLSFFMTTKLVYILTCAPESHYIEQALMAIWSARYHNPDAHIVLLTDDKTDLLLTGTRGELTKYVTEKIVVPFEDESLSMMYRSRWIKTSVRELIAGNFMFIDCDTLVCRSLSDVDSFECEVGAVLESHLLVEDFGHGLRKAATEANRRIGVDLNAEKEYFSSGVLYVKDTPQTHSLYHLWHECWLESFQLGLPIDQPSLAKSNREVGHIVQKIPDTYNCILFTQNSFTDKAHILHIASFRNPCFLFTEEVFNLLKNEGLVGWVKECLLHPCDSFLPFDYVVRHSTRKERVNWRKSIASTSETIRENLPGLIDKFPMQSSMRGIVCWLFRHRFHKLGALVWMSWKRMQVLRKQGLKENICQN